MKNTKFFLSERKKNISKFTGIFKYCCLTGIFTFVIALAACSDFTAPTEVNDKSSSDISDTTNVIQRRRPPTAAEQLAEKIYWWFGKHYASGCVTGEGACGFCPGCQSTYPPGDEPVISTAYYGEGILTLDCITPIKGNPNELIMQEDLIFEEQHYRTLGVEFMAIKKGRYTIDYSTNRNGMIQIRATNKRPECLLLEYTNEAYVKIPGSRIHTIGGPQDEKYIVQLCETTQHSLMCSGPIFKDNCSETEKIFGLSANISELENNPEIMNMIKTALVKSGLLLVN